MILDYYVTGIVNCNVSLFTPVHVHCTALRITLLLENIFLLTLTVKHNNVFGLMK